MKKIALMVDTASDMPEELIKKYDVGTVNFMVTFGDESFIAKEELSTEDFYKKVKESGIHPKTAQTPYQTLYDAILKYAKECETLLFYTISSKASGQYQTATLIARELMEENPELDIRVIDTMAFSQYITAAAVYAAELIEQGASADEIVEKSTEYVKKWEACFVVDDLNYLMKGGRINRATAVVGSVLDIKPALGVRDGIIDTIAKIRGKKKVFKKMIEIIEETEGFVAEKTKIAIVHTDEEAAKDFAAVIADAFGEDKIWMIEPIGPVIGAHVGPGCVAAIYYKENA